MDRPCQPDEEPRVKVQVDLHRAQQRREAGTSEHQPLLPLGVVCDGLAVPALLLAIALWIGRQEV
eukprot:COSAG01_NODE_23650_length_807_cov_0.744350_1_plen_64_part_10